MGNLFLRRLECVEETTELGDDSPYFVIFLGRPTSLPTVYVNMFSIRRDYWDDDVSTGYVENLNQDVPGAWVSPGDVVLVALIEEDGNADLIVSSNNLQTQMKNAFQTIVNQHKPITPSSLATIESLTRSQFITRINNTLGNDDLVDVRALKIKSSPGTLDSVTFTGQGGKYKATFATV